MADQLQQLQAWMADVSVGSQRALLQLLSKGDLEGSPNKDDEVTPAPLQPPQFPPLLHELDKPKDQVGRSCSDWRRKSLELRLQGDRQAVRLECWVRNTLQGRQHRANGAPRPRVRRRRTSQGMQLVNAVGKEEPSVAPKEGASKNASGVGASKNALAGGLAGGLVAVSLYPVDTIKTLIQAETGAGQRSIPRIFQRLMEKHGAFGLYRGLGSNLVTATPISAIYASTYEAVKELLLPHLPPRFHSVAHCGAGAAASVATSFVFTPSEVVKQRMQYTTQFANSWSAFVGILKTEGLSSLYNGWGAVLARNIPNSIIKFYTYESLKKFALDRRPGATRLTQAESLVIGGISGVSAAFCTTPFDVVKTRLQNQMPGQTIQYGGVAQCLQRILAEEGLPGLYRGVGPRLFIYVSQGAIFFASYEVLKRMLHDEWRITAREKGQLVRQNAGASVPRNKEAKLA